MRTPDAPEEHETRYDERLERALRAGARLSDEVLDTQAGSAILDAIVEDHAAKPIWLLDDFHSHSLISLRLEAPAGSTISSDRLREVQGRWLSSLATQIAANETIAVERFRVRSHLAVGGICGVAGYANSDDSLHQGRIVMILFIRGRAGSTVVIDKANAAIQAHSRFVRVLPDTDPEALEMRAQRDGARTVTLNLIPVVLSSG